MKRSLSIATALGLIGLLIFVLAKAFGTDPHAVPFMLTGKAAPNFTLKRLDNGEVVSLAAFKGKPVVLNFWATWCGPCKQEHPVLERASKRYAGKAEFFGIVFEDNEENTKRFLAENGWGFVQLFDPKSTVSVDFGVAGVPETYFVAKDGTIRSKYAAPLDEFTMAAKLSEIVEDPAVEATVKSALDAIKTAQLTKYPVPSERTTTFVRALAFTGRGLDEIVDLAKQDEKGAL